MRSWSPSVYARFSCVYVDMLYVAEWLQRRGWSNDPTETGFYWGKSPMFDAFKDGWKVATNEHELCISCVRGAMIGHVALQSQARYAEQSLDP